MLRIYISYAPADRPYLDTLLKWLQPLKEKYFLRIWHNPIPLPGAVLPYQWDAMLDNLEASHLYLFLTSYHSLSTAHIEQEEIPRAVERHVKFGDELIRVYPVLLSPSQWKKHSGLASYTPLEPQQTLAGLKPDENGYLALVEQLEEIVITLRRNWMEEHRRLGLPLDEFSKPATPSAEAQGLKPIPGWVSVALLFVILYLVTGWYFEGCAPRMYFMYTPESMPYQPPPERYLRENPVREPVDVPFPPPDDTVGRRVRVVE